MRTPKILLLALLAILTAACSRDPKVQRQKYLESGNRYFNNSKFKEASIMYRRSLQQDMRFGEAYYRLGLAELKLARPSEALRALQRAVELDANNQDAAAKVAEIFLAAYSSDPKHPAQYLKEVEDMTKKLLEKNPKSFDGLRLRGYLALTKRDLKGAIADFEAANQQKPNDTGLVMVLAQSLLADNRQADAEKLVRDGLAKDKTFSSYYDFLYALLMRANREPDAEKLLREKSSANPKNALFILQLAGHYLALKRPADVETQLQRILSNEKDFPQGRALVGDFYFRSQQFDKAIALYREGAKGDPKIKADYDKRIVQTLMLQGKTSEATQLVGEILKTNPKDDGALAMRAALILRTGTRDQLQMAINDLQAVVSRSPENPVLRYEYGRALLSKGDIDLARLQMLEAIKLRPDFLPARIALTQIYVTKGDFTNASTAANEVLQYDANNIPAKLLRSSAMIGLRQYVDARRELTAMLQSNPELTDAQFQLGMLNMNEGKVKEAETVFRRLYQQAPRDPRGLMGAVQALSAQKEHDQAMELIRQELAKAPERNDLRMALAATAYRAQKFELAVTEYQKLHDKYPKDMTVMLRLSESLRAKGDTDGAIQITEKALAQEPNNPLPTLTLAMLHETKGQADKSKGYYEKVLVVEPDNPLALNNLAYIFAENGTNLDQALTMVQKAKQKLPNNPEVSDTLGWIYIKKNLSDSAIGIYRELLQKYPDRPTFHYHLAMAYFQKGDKPQAKKLLQAALQKNPSKNEEGKIRDLIAKVS